MGLYGLSEDIGLMIGSGLGGFVWSALGYQATFLMGSGSAALGILVVIVLMKVIKPRMQEETLLSQGGAV
jgi:predicted MFS family arabinose efflux permease